MLQVYPYGLASLYTASFAITSSFAQVANRVDYVVTASNAGTVLEPETGNKAAINTCLITFEQYLALLASTNNYEVCIF